MGTAAASVANVAGRNHPRSPVGRCRADKKQAVWLARIGTQSAELVPRTAAYPAQQFPGGEIPITAQPGNGRMVVDWQLRLDRFRSPGRLFVRPPCSEAQRFRVDPKPGPLPALVKREGRHLAGSFRYRDPQF